MIPKGAAIFFIVGLVAAGLLGSYLLQVANQIPTLVYENGPSLTIIPEKINYRPGELIHIRIINSGTVPLTFEDSSYGLKIVQLDGTVIYSPISTHVVSKLDPKEEKNFVWNQIKSDGSKIYQGRYKIISNASLDNGNVLQRSVTINILT
ncbi:hypothetical protein [Candidatus Nitrosotalea okcheonensis]|uniref:Intracellular proteinase inhibitor BsuPI domain-containing protein n=1 Tax=Candidatus Nitrosotalea okcheonensis TaxID=1903276 RepID=A0A2H1FIA9_9ARCH|nr:hypothetical protein [Candidatus Nitrosotalea okcheonensis]MDE1832254.1 hypothetical protein [Nitrososphaerota archaeon]MDE1877715.1 hypothetical protein [Nitrososphaerota archaeon]SMH72508.1 conserved exported protein of unknown function [Candidatus Nitrosotalea okcheonensis]